MARSRSRRPLIAPALDQQTGLIHALRHTLPGRLIVVGVAIRIAILIVVFFLLGGFLLFYNLSSYLVQSRIRALSDEARFIARSTALEIQRAGGRDVTGIVSGRQANAAQQFPGMSLVVVPVNRPC